MTAQAPLFKPKYVPSRVHTKKELCVGVDPGAKHIGMVCVDCVTHHLYDSTDLRVPRLLTGQKFTPWAAEAEGLDKLAKDFGNVLQTWSRAYGRIVLAAVEATVNPGWAHGHSVATAPVMRTAFVEGLLLGWMFARNVDHTVHVRVPPAKYGQKEYGTYPPVLVSEREKVGEYWGERTAGKGKFCHRRAAYDMALTAIRKAGVSQDETGKPSVLR